MKPGIISTVAAIFVFLIVFVCAAAQDWPIFDAPQGKTYVPIVDANHAAGDDYYYGSMIKQVVKGYIPPFPSNDKQDDKSHPDQQRFLPYLAAALPGLVTTDARVSIAFARSFPIAVLAGLGTLFAMMLSGRIILGIVAGIGSTLYFPFWRDSPLGPGSLSPHAFAGWADTAGYIFHRSVGLLWPVVDLSISHDLYRLAVPSIPFILLLTAFLLTHSMLVQTNKKWIPFQVIIFIFSLYSYPSHIPLILVMYFTQFVYLYYRDRSKNLLIWQLLGLGVIIVWVFVTGYIQATLQAYFASDAFNAIYNSNGASGANGFLSFQPALFVDAIVNKYLLAIAMLLTAAKFIPRLRATAILVIPCVLAADVTIIFGSRLSARFLQRGVDQLLWLAILVAVLALLQAAWSYASSQWRIPGAIKRVLPVLAATVALVLAGWPLVGLLHYAGKNVGEGYHYVSSDVWNVYRGVEAMVRRPDRVAVPDADDLHYLTTYFDVAASAGPMELTNIPLTDVLAANAAMWRALGLSRAHYQDWAEGTVEAELERRSSPNIPSGTPPYVDQATFLKSRIAAYVYYPYTLDVAGIPIAIDGKTNPNFARFLMSQFDASPGNLADYAREFGVAYLLISDKVLKLVDPVRIEQLGAPLIDAAGHQLYHLTQ